MGTDILQVSGSIEVLYCLTQRGRGRRQTSRWRRDCSTNDECYRRGHPRSDRECRRRDNYHRLEEARGEAERRARSRRRRDSEDRSYSLVQEDRLGRTHRRLYSKTSQRSKSTSGPRRTYAKKGSRAKQRTTRKVHCRSVIAR
jgi:hypothetical protein